MSIGPLSPIQDAAAIPLAQAQGARIERALHDAQTHARRVDGDRRSESAARIDGLDADTSVTDDHAADGRLAWQPPAGGEHDTAPEDSPSAKDRDPSDSAVGRGLDLIA